MSMVVGGGVSRHIVEASRVYYEQDPDELIAAITRGDEAYVRACFEEIFANNFNPELYDDREEWTDEFILVNLPTLLLTAMQQSQAAIKNLLLEYILRLHNVKWLKRKPDYLLQNMWMVIIFGSPDQAWVAELLQDNTIRAAILDLPKFSKMLLEEWSTISDETYAKWRSLPIGFRLDILLNYLDKVDKGKLTATKCDYVIQYLSDPELFRQFCRMRWGNLLLAVTRDVFESKDLAADDFYTTEPQKKIILLLAMIQHAQSREDLLKYLRHLTQMRVVYANLQLGDETANAAFNLLNELSNKVPEVASYALGICRYKAFMLRNQTTVFFQELFKHKYKDLSPLCKYILDDLLADPNFITNQAEKALVVNFMEIHELETTILATCNFIDFAVNVGKRADLDEQLYSKLANFLFNRPTAIALTHVGVQAIAACAHEPILTEVLIHYLHVDLELNDRHPSYTEKLVEFAKKALALQHLTEGLQILFTSDPAYQTLELLELIRTLCFHLSQQTIALQDRSLYPPELVEFAADFAKEIKGISAWETHLRGSCEAKLASLGGAVPTSTLPQMAAAQEKERAELTRLVQMLETPHSLGASYRALPPAPSSSATPTG